MLVRETVTTNFIVFGLTWLKSECIPIFMILIQQNMSNRTLYKPNFKKRKSLLIYGFTVHDPAYKSVHPFSCFKYMTDPAYKSVHPFSCFKYMTDPAYKSVHTFSCFKYMRNSLLMLFISYLGYTPTNTYVLFF